MPPPVPKKPLKNHPPPLARDRSLESSERQRLEARKRLLAAKRAASVRQSSTTESADSIEIYIPEAQTRLWNEHLLTSTTPHRPINAVALNGNARVLTLSLFLLNFQITLGGNTHNGHSLNSKCTLKVFIELFIYLHKCISTFRLPALM